MVLDNLKIIQQLLKLDLDEYQNLSDLFAMLKHYEPEGFEFAHKLNRKVRSVANRQTTNNDLDDSICVKFNELYKQSLLFDARYEFDAYLLYVEFDREPDKKFYVPRRRFLKERLIDYLQALADDEIDILTVSMPPGTGKSTAGIFFLSWLMGRNPEMCNLASGHADGLTRGFYDGVMSIITDPEYLWKDVFPDVKLANKSAKYETIDLNTVKRFPSLTCRAIDGSLTGATRCEGILYVDDLVSGIEEALSVDRMDKLWIKYFNDLKSRKKMKCKELHIATRWSVHDPIGRLERANEANPRARFICIPAYDENGESNFNYDYGVGFDTEYFKNIEKDMDEVSFLALYMNQPIEREGLLFPEKSLRYWNGVLPDNIDAVYSACDVAWGGGDRLSQPFAYECGDTVYIKDWIFNKGDKSITRPIVIGKMAYHKPQRTKFEANNGGHEYSDIVDDELHKINVRLNISSAVSPSNKNKVGRIVRWSPEIKHKFVFLDKQNRDKEYDDAMREVTTFLQTGKSPHEDAPDSLSMLAELIYEGSGSYEIIDRLW